MIKGKEVWGGPALEIPKELTFGKYVINQLKENCIHGDKIALINGKTEEQTSYRELVCKVARISSGLRRLGIQPGDVVAVSSENCTQHIAAVVAASAAGAVVTLINVKYTKDETQHALNIAKPTLIFSSKSSLAGKLNIFRQTSCVKHIVQLSGAVTDNDVMSLAALEALDEYNTGEYEPQRGCASADTAFIFYSSGTTGLPKGVMLTHQNVLYGTTVYNYENKSKENVLTIIPWYHVYGLLTTIQYLVSGNLVVYLTELIPDQYLASIEKYQISEIPAVPPMVYVFAKSSLVEKYDLSSVKYILSAASTLSVDIISDAQKSLPNCKGIYQAFGMTETTLVILKEPFCARKTTKGGCGVPLPGITAKVVHVETREKLGPNEQGEVCFMGPTLMKGYIDNEAATRSMFDEDGYIKSGDIGYYDADGCFYIVDRLKEIFKYKGHQVAPATVEAVIMTHDGVADCGVVGLPDESAGELPTAFVVKKPGVSLTEQELLDFTTARLSPMSKIRGGIIFVAEIPKNVSGKIVRRELRNKLMELKRAY